MAARLRLLISNDHRRRRTYWLILALLLLLHVFMFRGVLAAAPQIISGGASIVREELVPFFTPSEYFPSSSSQLTGSDEFRVSYSFWTSWTRYNPILPFMLVIVNTISAFMLFYAFFRIVRHFAGKREGTAMYASLLAALLIHGVMLYAKIAHFYTLILGFSMFALAISLVLEQLLFAKDLNKRNILAVSALTLLNPAIHYHVIFYLVLAVALLLSIVLRPHLKRGDRWSTIQRNLAYVMIVGLLSLVPYLVYLRLTAPAAGAVFSATPVNYWMIYYSSVPLQFLFSLDSLGHLDLYRYGNYLAPLPRMLTMIGFGLIASLVFFKQWRELDRIRRTFLLTLMLLLLLAMWMSIGYSSDSLFSFHNFLGSLGGFVAAHANAFTTDLGKLLDIFINVLRFPHRFEFIVFYTAGTLTGIGLTWLAGMGGKDRLHRIGAVAAAGLIILVPFMGSSAYRQTFVSGDFDGFLAPYHVPRDLSQIKTTLANTGGAKRVFILPSMESGRQIPGTQTDYTFLDKYLIYYLGQPSLYNGAGADTANKIVAFTVYRALAHDEDWWQDILIHDFGITHLLIPRNIENRPKTITYFRGIEQKLAKSLDRSDQFQPVYEGHDYALYEASGSTTNDGQLAAKKSGPDTLVDFSWDKLLQTLNGRGIGAGSIFFPVQINRTLQHGSRATSKFSLISDNPERSFYRLYTTKKGTSFSPNLSLLPFTSDLIASSDFTTNMFSLTTLYNKENSYNYTGEVVPSLLNVRSTQFIGLRPGARAPIVTQISVPHDGHYRLLLHAASRAANIHITDGDQKYHLSRISSEATPRGHIDFSYYSLDVKLTKGVHTLAIRGGEATILAERIGLIPKEDVPKNFSRVHQNGLTIAPAGKSGTYDVELTP